MLGGPTALSNRIDQSGPWYLVAFQMEIKPKPEGLGDLGCRLNCYPASQLARRQPAIKASTSPSHQSGQSVICAVLDSVDSRKVQRPALSSTKIRFSQFQLIGQSRFENPSF